MRRILILGLGSAGQRHLKNFSSLGCLIDGYDPRIDRLREVKVSHPVDQLYCKYTEVLKGLSRYDGIVICSPPKFHFEQALSAISNKLFVLLEKPITKELAEAYKLVLAEDCSQGTKVLLGYTYRWLNSVARMRALILSGEIGRPLFVNVVMSGHLADWHPWESYKDFFMASSDLGGGALLDESHFIDLMLWIFGMPEQVFCKVSKNSGLEIETDDNADILLLYDHGLNISIHLDIFGRPHEKSIKVVAEGATLNWTSSPNSIRYSDRADGVWTQEEFYDDRNDMFIGVAREFLDMIDGKVQDELTCNLTDGLAVMRVIEACRESSSTNRVVRLTDL